jgi:Protein of unknown function (DUF3035)
MVKWVVIGVGALALSACGSSGIFGRDAPDEFAIGRSAPLVVPPDYNLAPPRPGAPRPLEQDSQTRAIEALFGPGVRPPPKSASEELLLKGAGADRTEAGARSTAGDPETSVVNKGALVKTIMDAPAGSSEASTASVSIGG